MDNHKTQSLHRLCALALSHCFALVVLTVIGCDSKSNTAKKQSTGQSETKTSIAADLELLKNRSVALVENGAEGEKEGKMIMEAADGFRTIIKQLPKEVLGYQNLAIALHFQIRNLRTKNADIKRLDLELRQTIDQLKKLTSDYPDAWILESRYFQDIGETNKAESALREATVKKAATADTFFQLIELQSGQGNQDPLETRKLIELALAKSPTNLAIIVAYLNNLATIQDEASFSKHFELTKDSFAPILSRTGSPLLKLFEKIQTALGKNDWKTIQTQTIFIRNSLLAEIAYVNDLHILRPHVLEYLKLNFEGTVALNDVAVLPAKIQAEALSIDSTAVTSIAAEDFDLDGRTDLIVGKSGAIEVWSFDDKTPRKLAEVALDAIVGGVVLADLDHDYQLRREALPSSALPTTAPPDAPPSSAANFLDTDVDVVVYGQNGLRFFENRLSEDKKSRSLVARPLSTGMEDLQGIRHATTIDFDHDSDLDLIVVSEGKGVTLWSNRGDWTFADFTSYSNVPEANKSLDSVNAFDADRNVLVDVLIGTTQSPGPKMLGNNLHGRYHLRDIVWSKELEGASRCIEPVDVNHDACWDLLTCGEKGVRLQLMKSPGRHGWLPDSAINLSDAPTVGLVVCDLNNDGQSDCVSWGSKGAEFFYGQPVGMPKKDSEISLRQELTQCALIDIDSDNDEDVVALAVDGKLTLLRNMDGNKQQQMEIILRADEDGSQRPRERCNMHGVGCLLELKANGTYQSKIVRGTKTRFGLGAETTADILRIVWTNGTPNNLFKVNNKSTVFDQQRLNASCPFLYAWNGERFDFCTDCLWAAPIGLQFGPGLLAPSREWEYLKIDGRGLKPKDGRYVLQVTEELWEAAYFDTIELMAIDHPSDVSVFTNEKVGPPDLAAHKIYTVKNRRLPKVIDPSGADISSLTSTRDQRFTKTWTQGIVQGVTEPHWIEVDLNLDGNTSDEKILYLTGWIFPTCTSLNLALAENPQRPEMTPPSLLVPDAQGNWVEIVPFTGFPGGKTKTIAIDLKGKFLSSDHRVRLLSNMELCWDEVFFTVDERQAVEGDYQAHRLALESADLHYRGFSEQRLQPANAPDYYDYSRVIKPSVWAPMAGAFTRYGDVQELLATSDDRQVVMGAGDEVTLHFTAPSNPLPEGWVRDFVIYNVGWDKDADLNTIYGQNVEPLPFRAMKSYPYGPEQQFPSTTEHLDYFKKYQTRLQNPGQFWNQIRDSL